MSEETCVDCEHDRRFVDSKGICRAPKETDNVASSICQHECRAWTMSEEAVELKHPFNPEPPEWTIGDSALCFDCGRPHSDHRAPSPVADQAVLSVIALALEPALQSYVCANTKIQDDEDSGLPLLDALTPHGDSDTQRGYEEIGLLADFLYGELQTALASVDQAKQEAVRNRNGEQNHANER